MNKHWTTFFKQRDHYELNTVSKLLKTLNFKKTFEIIHIVGTNGKGSVATILHHNLMKKGYKVGLFTSPHLKNPYERIKVNNKLISDDEFTKIFDLLPQKMNFFVIFYIVAMIHFMQKSCDIVILEAGLGARLDATNTIKGKYGIITSVDYDHMDLLGDSLKKIALEKLMIRDKAMRFYVPLKINKRIISLFNQSNTFFVANFARTYQEQNFILAKIFLNIEFKIFDVEDIKVQGRNEIFFNNNHITVFDVGHNESGIEATLKLLKTQKIFIKDILIMLSNSKKINKLPELFKKYDVHYAQKNHHFHNFSMFNWKKVDDIEMFFKCQKAPTLYIGSFHLIGDLYDLKT